MATTTTTTTQHDKNKNQIIYFDSVTTQPFTVRVTPDNKASVLDIIQHVSGQSRKASRQKWFEYKRDNPDINQLFEGATSTGSLFKFKGRGQNATPVILVRPLSIASK